jgi:hypothetical protein
LNEIKIFWYNLMRCFKRTQKIRWKCKNIPCTCSLNYLLFRVLIISSFLYQLIKLLNTNPHIFSFLAIESQFFNFENLSMMIPNLVLIRAIELSWFYIASYLSYITCLYQHISDINLNPLKLNRFGSTIDLRVLF